MTLSQRNRPGTTVAGGRSALDAGHVLVAAGLVVALAAVAAYLAAIAAHPMAAMLKGFDLRVYLGGAGQALHHPGDLYTWTYDGHPGIKFTYPPFAALLFAGGLAVPFPVLMPLVAAASVLALVVTVAIAFRALGWRGAPRLGATLLVAGLALWTEPAQRALFLGQVEPALMALVTWDLCQPDGRRWKGAATGLAAGIKLVPLLFIVYLLLIRRFRQAALAAGAFTLTIAVGATAFPAASAAWWLGGDFLQAGRTGFVGGQQNQSLRGALTRLLGSVAGSEPAWFAVAAVVAVAGLTAAVLLHRHGRPFASLMGCALTALLVSPVSWDHHWVWIAPGLALLIDAALGAARAEATAGLAAVASHDRGSKAGTAPPAKAIHPIRPTLPPSNPRRFHDRGSYTANSAVYDPRASGRPPARRRTKAGGGWYVLAAATWALFAAWPECWNPRAGLLQGGLIGYAPASAWAHGDNPSYAEYHWRGLQLLAGNLELIVGLALFAVLLATALRQCRPRHPRKAAALYRDRT